MASSIQEVKIKIEYDDKSGNDPKSPVSKITPKQVDKDSSNVLKSVVVHQAVDVAKNLIVQSLNGTANRYFSMKEDYISENIYNATMSTLGKTVKIGTAIVGGYAIGNVAGAIIGGVGAIVSEGVSLYNKYSNYYSTLNASNMNVDFARTRAGLIDNGRGTEN